MGYKRKKSNTVLNKKTTKEVVEQEVHIKKINEEEKQQILIGDDKGIDPVSDTPLIYGDLSGLENDDQPQYPLIEEKPQIIIGGREILPEEEIVEETTEEEEIVEEEEVVKPRDLKSLSKSELRYYQRTGVIPK